MFILAGLFIVIIIGILFLTIQLRKREIKKASLSFFLTLILSVITSGLLATYFLIGLSCMDGCYVKKYSPKWLFTMNQSDIGNLPVIQPINEVQYYYDTDLGERWEVTYESKSKLNAIQKEIESYLTNNKVEPNPKTSCYNGYWDINDKTIVLRYESIESCIMIYLDNKESHVLVRALEMK
jgi:energy-coupling factor transporter transmembrane protein EcfT